jgi:Tfp pilus assembly protein PilF
MEIEPAVLAADQYFRPHNGNPTADPRLTLHLEDGRTFIARAQQPYDVIISEPSNPWLAGINNLFTVDFYRLVKGSLAPSGVFCQWMQFYEMSGVTLASLVGSLHEVFPDAQVFLSNRDMLFVATQDGRPLDTRMVAERLALGPISRDLARANVNTVADLVALRQSTISGTLARLPKAPLNLDDRPFVEYRAPIDFYSILPSELPFSEHSAGAGDPVAGLETWTTGTPSFDLALDVTSALMERGSLAGANTWLQGLIARDPSRAEPLLAELRAAARRRDRDAQLVQARQALAADDRLATRRLLAALLRDDPNDAAALIEGARVLMREDSTAAARRMLEHALRFAAGDDRFQAVVNLGIIEMREGRVEQGMGRFSEASRLRPAELAPWLYQARALVQQGHGDEAAQLLERARAVVADSAGLGIAMQQLSTTGALQ